MTQRARQVLAVLTLGIALAAAYGIGYWSRGDTAPRAVDRPGAVDIGFCQDMSVHHAQAVVMAQDALGLSQSPEVKDVARQILIGQSQQRGMMSGWLTEWDAPQLPDGPPMTWMDESSMAGMAHGTTTMPGMATQAELDRLGSLHGKAFDVLFLQLMIRHHAGGILMAVDAQQHAGLNEVRALAGQIVLDQTQENAIMTQLLINDGAQPLR